MGTRIHTTHRERGGGGGGGGGREREVEVESFESVSEYLEINNTKEVGKGTIAQMHSVCYTY